MNLSKTSRILLAWLPAIAVTLAGCNDDVTNEDNAGTETGDGDGDPGDGDGDSGDGDGDPGDGDGDPGDGDGDPGDGDGDPGDGDGDPGDGDGDPGDLVLTGLTPLGVYESGIFGESAAEITAFDPASARLFVVNASSGAIDVLDLSDPTSPTLIDSFDVTPYGAAANSVAVYDGLVAAAVEANVKQDPGAVVLFDAADLSVLNDLTVGALPDMLTFSPDGTKLVVACEGEPSGYAMDSVDPEGSIAILDVSGDIAALTDGDVQIAGFGAFTLANLDPQVRVFGPGASVAQDLEPEYVAISEDSSTAWVVLQENNALAVVDLNTATVTQIVPLGYKNHSLAGNGLDPSDRDDGVAIANWPVFGMYMPDAIVRFTVAGQTYLLTANEGDARDYPGFSEEARIKSLPLDPVAFPNAAALKADEALGRLTVTTVNGDPDNDGDYDQLFAFGGRSISVWATNGNLLWDSGDELEQVTALALPNHFNANNNDNEIDNRSDNKGPEPEGAAVATLWGVPYAFIGLERVGGVMVYDLSNPLAPSLVLYDVSTRDFDEDPQTGAPGDLGPEGLEVIAAADSPTGEPLLIVANEVSGTVRIYRIDAE
jgi:hypothetical protein